LSFLVIFTLDMLRLSYFANFPRYFVIYCRTIRSQINQAINDILQEKVSCFSFFLVPLDKKKTSIYCVCLLLIPSRVK
jgi:hypothetical protein